MAPADDILAFVRRVAEQFAPGRIVLFGSYAYGQGGNDTMYGGEGDDFQDGQAGNDFNDGQAGNDVFYGDLGADTYMGGDGVDGVDFSGRAVALTLTADDVGNDGASGEGDNIRPDLENIVGGAPAAITTMAETAAIRNTPTTAPTTIGAAMGRTR